MDRIAIWDCWDNVDAEGLTDYFYDALWFLKRCGDETLSFATLPRWWDAPDEAQPYVQAALTHGVYGALTFALPGSLARRASGLPDLTEEHKRGLRTWGWIPPKKSGLAAWTLPEPDPIEGFIRRYAEVLAETCMHVFNAELRHLLIEFGRPTPPGRERYVAPLPFLLQNEAELYVE